jgi:hypothetical protein
MMRATVSLSERCVLLKAARFFSLSRPSLPPELRVVPRILAFACATFALLSLALPSPAAGETHPDIALEKTSQVDSAYLAGHVDLSVTGSGSAVEEPQFLDLVTILDRTGSMTGADMENAKDGVRALLQYLDPGLHRVGLGVIPGGKTSPPDPCDAPGTYPEPPAEDYANYLPVGLSDDYQNTDGTLNESSLLVSTIGCLEAEGYTNVGSPMAAAIGELQTNGRPGEKWGIILLSDGVANRPIGGDTGWKSPTANAAASGGDNNGFQTNPTGAYQDDTSYAQDSNSGTNTSTDCGDAGKDRHIYYNYGISVPGTNDVIGISVRLIARIDSTYSTTTRRMCVQLSWDGGVTWTTAKQTSNLSSSHQTFTLGGSSDNWGHNWTPSELPNANFRVRITDVASRTDRTFDLDWAAVRVYHSAGQGPCHYAAAQADIAKAAGIEVFTIGYGLHDPDNPGGNYCNDDDTGGWGDRPGWELMEYMATDADHFFDQPSTADLRRVFQMIATNMTVGGTVELEGVLTDRSDLQSGAESPPLIPLAALSAIALLALAAGIWYARRRRA